MIVHCRKALLCAFLALLIALSAGASLTFARYSEEMGSGGVYSGALDFVVSEQIEIHSVDEFFTAIENGYTNIKIADEVDNPLVVTGGVSDVNSDLTIDLNGHELQRNNREPLLNVTHGVRLTVIDSSQEKTGCFYNPVGSVLAVSGGTLTVTGGVFESGPRNGESLSDPSGTAHYSSEYASGSGSNWVTPAGARTEGTESTEVFRKDTVTGEYPQTGERDAMPVLVPNVVERTDGEDIRYAVNGNMYFAQDASAIGIDADTYLYFTMEGDNIDGTRISAGTASAEFYYSYYMKRTESGGKVSYEYAASEGADTVLVTVYGYERVKASSKDTAFAAIRMEGGNLYVRGGVYTTYFGESNTYCVHASGGYMAVETGVFEAQENSVCVTVAYDAPTENEYLRVAHGNFYSQVGDTVQVAGGRMSVSGGSFSKDASGHAATAAGANNAVIRIDGGELTVSGTAANPVLFSLEGSCLYGIRSEVSSAGETGTVTVTNASFTFNGGTAGGNHTNYGICSGGGTVTVNGCTFSMPDEESRGISVEAGTVNVNGAGGRSDGDTYSYFYIDKVAGCYGVYAGAEEGVSGNVQVNVNAAQFFMGQNAGGSLGVGDGTMNGAGIYMDASGGDSKVSLRNALVVAAGNGSCGVYARRGNIVQTSGKLVAVTGAQVQNYQTGVTQFRSVENYTAQTDLLAEGRVVRSGISYGYGVYSGGGDISLHDVFSAVYGKYSAGVLAMAEDAASGADVSVAGTFESVVSIGDSVGGILSSTAISTENSDVTLSGSADILTDGLGITARGGNVTFGSDDATEATLKLTSTRGTALYVNGGSVRIAGNFTTYIVSTIVANYAWAERPGGGGAPASQTNGVYVQGGSLTAEGTFNVSHVGLNNEDQSETDADGNIVNAATLYYTFEVKSYAVRVEGDAGNAASVSLTGGSLTNQAGGGLYVSGGNVTLGNVTASAEGEARQGPSIRIPGADSNWTYQQSLTGGNAVELSGGTLTVSGGTYTAAQGNGILVRGGTANVYGGSFYGNDGYEISGGSVAGAAASYALKMYGGTANIYGGTFGENSSGSGAFFMGTAADAVADANIYGGSFRVKGQAGVSIYQYADVLFAPRGGENGAGGDIAVSGNITAVAIEITKDENGNFVSSRAPSVEIRGGLFESTTADTGANADGIWCGNSGSALIISGGTFTGSMRYGVYIEQGASVKLSGGSYSGPKGALGGGSYTLETGYTKSWQGDVMTVVPSS